MDEVEYEDIELLAMVSPRPSWCGVRERRDAGPLLLQRDGRRAVNARGPDEDQAVEYVNEVTEGAKILWIHPLELQPEFSPDNRPHTCDWCTDGLRRKDQAQHRRQASQRLRWKSAEWKCQRCGKDYGEASGSPM